MDAELDSLIGRLTKALRYREVSTEIVLASEKKLEIARQHEASAQLEVDTLSQMLRDLLHRAEPKAMGDIYREQGVEGYENWKR